MRVVGSVPLCSNSTYSICCGFVVQLVVQQIHNKSKCLQQIHNKSKVVQQIYNFLTCQDVVDLLWTCRRVAANHQGRSDGGYIGIYSPKNKKISNRFVHVWVEMHDEIFYFEIFKNFDDNFEIF